ncbi:nuclease-related domain-containing protein [Nonomuraea typhae]|uniref:nuclease-related domain-containing protein n=1 Tax=Nonomuraea typhae TaxID=2603600 RepID=UPI0012FA481B|nr:nuclease-related domain-containing protein [Nonomuraea typhae]
MSVTVHGTPGWSLNDTGAAKYGSNARRGAFHERQVARALVQWLTSRPDHFHLFHDLECFDQVRGANLDALSLGTTNIDHVVLTGGTWLIIDAKGCGAGTLGLDLAGKGVLVRTDGTMVPQRWLDDGRAYSRAGIIYRLTDAMPGQTAWIVPDTTSLHPSLRPDLRAAGSMKKGGMVLPMRAITDGYFNGHFPAPQPAADPAHVEKLAAHLSTRRKEH